jgi:2',3'-cyclic-nucleotide 2'-phosphodiesterase (5'-nucleotidase family)
MARLLHYSDIEHVFDDPDRAARLAGSIRDRDGEDALVVGTGDTFAPGVLPLVERGRQAIPFYRMAGVDLETFGNHDFDFGPDATRRIVADAPTTWVSANVRDEEGDRFGATDGVVSHVVREVGDRSVGFVGVTDPATDSLNPQATDLTFTDPIAAVGDAAATLRADGAEAVVVLSHLGAGDDELAAETDVDVVLGGHVHAERAAWVQGTLCTRPGAGGHVFLEVDLEAVLAAPDGEGRTAADGGVDADGDADGDERVPAPVTRHEVATGRAHGPLSDRLRGRVAAAGLDESVGYADEPLPRDDATVSAGECRIGNLIADAYRWAGEADVGLQNSGGIRNGPPLSGTVTKADVVSVLPFEEPLVVAEVTGAELREVFAECAETDAAFGEPGWWHGHVSGARLWFEDGHLVRAEVDGDPLVDDRVYEVATASYLLHSDHEFPTLTERHRARECGIEYEVLAEYVAGHGTGVELGRIQRG